MSNSTHSKHKERMSRHKEKVDQSISKANQERGLILVITGNGKGKSTSAFGMVLRALGHGQKVGVVQFIKGEQLSGEEIFLKESHPEIPFYQMGTGFTWESQDREKDIAAAEKTWEVACQMLTDETLDLVVLDELTYMIAYRYLDETIILDTLRNRPPEQSVVITGRGASVKLTELADTVSNVEPTKHAFQSGIKARKGVDF